MKLQGIQHLSRIASGVSRAACTVLISIGVVSTAHVGSAQQVFDSGSTGADGPLAFACDPGGEVIEWDPDNDGLDADGDRVFHFTTIDVGSTCTLQLTTPKLGQTPVAWLATGAVVINGTVSLNGNPGHSSALGSIRTPSLPGPGGFAGGLGPVNGVGAWTDGFGPGAGRTVCPNGGAGAGYLNAGSENQCGGATPGGDAYGNLFLLPLIGGSGGSGNNGGGGGGAGAGALLIASSTSITVNGGAQVRANGGNGRNGAGGGSGGGLRLVAPVVSGSGSILVTGGVGGTCCSWGNGSVGRIRIEAFDHQFTGPKTGGALFVTLAPTTVLFGGSVSPIPTVRVTMVSGTDADGAPFAEVVPETPTGGFTPADVTINALDPVLIEVESENVPAGTTVMVEVHSESLGTETYVTTPLAGGSDPLTASVSAPIDPGFNAVTLRANFGGP